MLEGTVSSAQVSPLVRPVVEVCPKEGLLHLDLQEIWRYRELLYFLVWREVKVRYKQAALGVAWAVLQPLMTMLIFTVVFGNFAKIPSDGLPYPVFAYAALLPWSCFAEAISRSGMSVVSDTNLVRKVYFPRLIMPLASVMTPVVDFCLSFLLLLCMMAWYHVIPTWGVILLPFFLLLAVLTALSVGLWLSALNVRYRDVRFTIPFLVLFWMYASPVAYPVSLVPEQWRLLFSLNPMVGVIEGFRWALLGKSSPDFQVIAISTIGVLVLLISGLLFFKRMERTFADVA
jgi:lipopolysaccharide transport system permease protein